MKTKVLTFIIGVMVMGSVLTGCSLPGETRHVTTYTEDENGSRTKVSEEIFDSDGNLIEKVEYVH